MNIVDSNKSSSLEQIQAEQVAFTIVEEKLGISLEKNKIIYLCDNSYTYIQPDFYSDVERVIGEIFVHIGKPKKAQNNKISNDILKMLLLEEKTNKKFRKIIVVCDQQEYTHLRGMSVLAECIRQFGIELMYVELDEDTRQRILSAQKRQEMVNG